MKTLKFVSSMLSLMFVACLQISVLGQTAEDKNKLSTLSGTGSSVRWDVCSQCRSNPYCLSA